MAEKHTCARREKSCTHCGKGFSPKPPNYAKQTHCGKPECRKASKRASQRKWLNKPQNRSVFRGPENVRRVQDWRKKHPGYWRRDSKSENRPKSSTLQDNSESEVDDRELDMEINSAQFSHATTIPRQQLQDNIESQAADIQPDSCTSADNGAVSGEGEPGSTLQDNWLSQPTVLLGLIVHLSGGTLQDNLVDVVRGFDGLGREYLGRLSRQSTTCKESIDYEQSHSPP